MYQLQRELGNTYMWEKENVLSYAARIEEIADRETGTRITIICQIKEIIIPRAIDTIITIIIIFCETEILIIDRKIWITTGMQIMNNFQIKTDNVK